MRIVLLGAPGAGKGTQAQLLADTLGVPKLSTGDILRSEISAGSDLGQQVQKVMQSGGLVPDELVLGIVENRISSAACASGFILDGFPRTVAQAEGLDKILKKHNLSLDHVVNLAVAENELVKRFTGRRVAPTSGRTYHVQHNPPKVAGQCDETGEALVQREDDREDVVRHRIEVYRSQTAPVLDYYRATGGRLQEVDGMQAVESVFNALTKVLNLSQAQTA